MQANSKENTVCSTYSLILMVKAGCSFKILVDLYHATLCHIAEGSILHSHPTRATNFIKCLYV